MLSAWRVKQESAHASLAVSLKRDSNRKLCNEEVLPAFGAKAQFRKAPIRWQLDTQEIVVANVVVPRDVEIRVG